VFDKGAGATHVTVAGGGFCATGTMRTPVQTVGDYELLEKIAEGGMGTVYRARQRATGTAVALKLVPSHLSSNSVLMKRFQQEYSAASSLNHPNIVRALEFGYHNSSPFMVMELIEGESLGQRLERVGRLPEAEAIRIIALVAHALHKAHKQNLIHRDVKPDNILLTADGQVKLADLGLVKELDADLNLTRTGRGLGTPHFMSPEQFRDAKNADARCDIYSLGATLYMTVTGEVPFKSMGPVDAWMKKLENRLTPARQLVPDLSERVSWAIERAMSADRNQRPASCREFIEDLTGHSTQRLSTPLGPMTKDLWYLMYNDTDGVLHMRKGTTAGIRRNLKDGALAGADNIRASRTKSGPFEPLVSHPEFRDLLINAAPITPQPLPRPSRPAVALPSRPAPVSAATPTPPNKVSSARADDAAPQTLPAPGAPHIDLGKAGSRSQWLRWLVFVGLAVVTGVASYYLMPKLP
jgi:serine/threonine protein kinase